MTRTIQRWSDQSESTLQDCFDHADSVSEFIRKCIGDVVPTVTITTYPNQKPWIDGGIRAKQKVRTSAFIRKNMAEFKECKAIKQVKCQYRDKVESQFNGSDTRRTVGTTSI